ncbi:MAG TPA: hypothetical protein VJ889_11485, partial [Pseudomonas sp.]|nr:hypothetical protein [Pseudomonas sp.]
VELSGHGREDAVPVDALAHCCLRFINSISYTMLKVTMLAQCFYWFSGFFTGRWSGWAGIV